MKQIKRLDDLAAYAGRIVYVKRNDYGFLGRLGEQAEPVRGTTTGYRLTRVMENGLSGRWDFTDQELRLFPHWIRPATFGELLGATPSYGENWLGQTFIFYLTLSNTFHIVSDRMMEKTACGWCWRPAVDRLKNAYYGAKMGELRGLAGQSRQLCRRCATRPLF